MNTTFNQYIDNTCYNITVPVTRVETLLSRIDTLNESRNFKKAYSILQPYLSTNAVVDQIAPNGKSKKDIALDIINELSKDGPDRGRMVRTVQNRLGISYASARHYVVNVAKF